MKSNLKNYIWMAIVAFVLYLAIHYWDGLIYAAAVFLQASRPLLFGLAAAYVINLPMTFFEKYYFPHTDNIWVQRSRRGVCMLLAFAAIGLVVYGVLRIVVPELVRCLRLLAGSLPDAINQVTQFLQNQELFSGEDAAADLAEIDWNTTLNKAISMLGGGMGNAADLALGAVTGVLSFSADLVIALIFSMYLLLEKETLCRQTQAVMHRYLPGSWIHKIMYVLRVMNASFSSFVTGQFTEAIILGLLCAGGMMLFGFPYAAAVGAVVGLTALIPVAGAYIGGAVGFLLILSVSWVRALFFILYLVVLQQLEGNLIYPKVVGSSMGLPGIWVLAAVIIGAGIGGIGGMVLSVPLASTLYELLRTDVHTHAAPCRPESPAADQTSGT